MSASAQANAGDNFEGRGDWAIANANALGIHQDVDGYTGATASASNSGNIDVAAVAIAHGGNDVYLTTGTITNEGAYASADAQASGAYQNVSTDNGAALASFANTGWINADASARAVSNSAYDASAQASAIGVAQYADGDDSSTATLTNSNTIHAGAIAVAEIMDATNTGPFNPTASAYAVATGVHQEVTNASTLSASLDNSGRIEAIVQATATGASSAYVGRSDTQYGLGELGGGDVEIGGVAAFGVVQIADDGVTGSEALTNSGVIFAQAYGKAESIDDYAKAEVGAVGVLQKITDVINGVATLTNEAMATIQAVASADAHSDFSTAWATANALGVMQYVGAMGDATALVNNDGNISATATGSASSPDDSAYVDVRAIGVSQIADAGTPVTAHATVNNTGEIQANATAMATGSQYVSADADATGINQFAFGPGEVYAAVNNDGQVVARAKAVAGRDTSNFGDENYASAEASGVFQEVDGGTTDTASGIPVYASIDLVNSSSGSITAFAEATAYGYGTGSGPTSNGDGYADARAYGVYQQVDGADGLQNMASLTNAGDINATARAHVYGYGSGGAVTGSAQATAWGVLQSAEGDSSAEYMFALLNTGSIWAEADANGQADDNTASAYGVLAQGSSDMVIGIDHVNDVGGEISASAQATTSVAGGARASAQAYGMWYSAGSLAGNVTNNGDVWAFASAEADDNPDARAIGISMNADVNNLTVTNTGQIRAYAHIDDSGISATGTVAATGIYAGVYNTNPSAAYFSPSSDLLTIVNNGGTIFAGLDTGSSDTVVRGNAINVADITDTDQGVEIDLKGTTNDGNIYGNILIPDHAIINVSDGRTRFNGMLGGVGGFNTTNPATYPGTLDIMDGGIFHLALNQDPLTPSSDRFVSSTEQPRVYIEQLTVESGGILSFGLSPDDAFGHYGQVIANSTDIEDGQFKGHFIPAYYAVSGTWTYVSVVDGLGSGAEFFGSDPISNTPLMTLMAQYHSGTYGDAVDIVATRNLFGSVPGLSGNQQSVADSIDSFYDGGSLDDEPYEDMDPFEKLIASIFALDGDQAYKDKLDELSAEPFAQQLDAALASLDGLGGILLDRLGGDGGGGGGALGFADENTAANSPASNAILTTGSVNPQTERASIWARGFGKWGSQSDPSAALAYTGNTIGGFVGGDVNVGMATFGLAGGFISNAMNFSNSNSITASGFQVAGYGRWDGDNMYIRGYGAYGAYSNDSKRYVTILNNPPELESGSYGSKIGGGYGEIGFTGWQGHMMGFVPFAGVGYTAGSNDAFSETGGAGALDVAAATASSLRSSLGAQWTLHSTIDNSPFNVTMRAAWEHEWSSLASVNAAFLADPTGDIGFVSQGTQTRDFAVISAAGNWFLAPMTVLSLQYDGKFGSGYISNAVSATVKQKF